MKELIDALIRERDRLWHSIFRPTKPGLCQDLYDRLYGYEELPKGDENGNSRVWLLDETEDNEKKRKAAERARENHADDLERMLGRCENIRHIPGIGGPPDPWPGEDLPCETWEGCAGAMEDR